MSSEAVMYEGGGEMQLYAPKHVIEQKMKALRVQYQTLYPSVKRTQPLYGNLPRVWSVYQAKEFLSTCKDREARDAFLLMLVYGLRSSEVSAISIVPGQSMVRIQNKKCGRIDHLPLITGSEHLIRKYRATHAVVFARWFREHLHDLGDTWTYRYHGQRMQYASHTLRRTGGNIMRSVTCDPYKAAIYLRHRPSRSFGTTAAYLHYPFDEMREDMNKAFGPLLAEFAR